MILSDEQIRKQRDAGNILIEPWDERCLGSNSYDVHLSKYFKTYPTMLDFKADNPTQEFEIPGEGFTLQPGRLYLGSTVEYTETRGLVPFIDGKSSVGRLGVNVHCTAGRGDAGFCNHWTLEISCVEPVIVYPGVPIAQLYYKTIFGTVLRPYDSKASAKYNGRDPRPQASRMWQNYKDGKWT